MADGNASEVQLRCCEIRLPIRCRGAPTEEELKYVLVSHLHARERMDVKMSQGVRMCIERTADREC